MKKIKYLIILLIFVPILSVKGYQLKCEYKSGSSTAYLIMDCPNNTCKITGGELNYHGTTHVIGFIDLGGVATKFANYPYTLDSCMPKMGLTNPPSAGVGLVKLDCDGILEYGCFTFDKETRTGTAEPDPTPGDNQGGSDKYVSVECKTGQYGYIAECGCMPSALTDLTKNIYLLLKIAAPTLLLIIGGFDLIKAMSSQDEKGINKAQQKLIKKFVAAALVFLVLVIVQTLVNIVAADTEGTIKCLNYILNGYNG